VTRAYRAQLVGLHVGVDRQRHRRVVPVPSRDDVRRMALVEHERHRGVAQPVQADTAQPDSRTQPLELIGVGLGPQRFAVLAHGHQAVIRPPEAERQRLGPALRGPTQRFSLVRLEGAPMSMPQRDLRVVDAETHSYRVVSLYRYMVSDSQAKDLDRNDIRLLCLDNNQLAEHRRAMAESVALRRRVYRTLRTPVSRW
jgi:hypothetical protein